MEVQKVGNTFIICIQLKFSLSLNGRLIYVFMYICMYEYVCMYVCCRTFFVTVASIGSSLFFSSFLRQYKLNEFYFQHMHDLILLRF